MTLKMAAQKPLKELLTDPVTTIEMMKDEECSPPITPPHSDESSPSLSPPQSDSSLPSSPDDTYSAEVLSLYVYLIKWVVLEVEENSIFSKWVHCCFAYLIFLYVHLSQSLLFCILLHVHHSRNVSDITCVI
jgi:hypothetical protein